MLSGWLSEPSSVSSPNLHLIPGQQAREGVVVSPVVALDSGLPAELRAQDHQCLVQ